MAEAVIIARDLLTRARLEEAASRAGMSVHVVSSVPPPPETQPALVLIDLDGGGEGLDEWRERWPDLRMVGFISHVDRAGTDAARALGIEVHPRGATTRAAEIIGR